MLNVLFDLLMATIILALIVSVLGLTALVFYGVIDSLKK